MSFRPKIIMSLSKIDRKEVKCQNCKYQHRLKALTTPLHLATRIINRDLTSAKLLISQLVKLSNTANFMPAFSGENNGKGAVKKIIEHLGSRIVKPWTINQASTSLCVPAVFFYCLAKNCPALYVKSVIELYLSWGNKN